MTHARQQIREAAATALTGLATTGSRVYQSRVHPLADSKLPCLLVSTDDEDVSRIDVHSPGINERSLDLVIRAVAKTKTNLDDTLDTMAAEVETALGNTTLSGKVKELYLTRISVAMTGEGETPVGELAMTWRAVYYTASNAPTAAI